MSWLPTPYEVQVEPFEAGAEDPFGNPVEAWGDPVPHKVYGWAAPSSREPKLAGHDRVVVDVEVYAPEGVTVNPRDRVTLPGDSRVFEVQGYPEDFNNGPFGWRPGVVVNLQAVEG